jgi:uncharacterized membrane protein YeaQ/YmgE (transglycosylase-associated protein family)
MGTLIGIALVGLVAGAIARLIVKSPGRLGCLGTILLGIAGAYAGGTLMTLLLDNRIGLRRTHSILGAILGSLVILVIWRALDRGERR